MTKEKNKKASEMIKGDKDFLTKILNVVKDLKGEINLVKQGGFKSETPSVKSISPEQDYIFQCVETQALDKVLPTPQDVVRYNQRSAEFKKKVEVLMKGHKVIQFTAMFLKRL